MLQRSLRQGFKLWRPTSRNIKGLPKKHQRQSQLVQIAESEDSFATPRLSYAKGASARSFNLPTSKTPSTGSISVLTPPLTVTIPAPAISAPFLFLKKKHKPTVYNIPNISSILQVSKITMSRKQLRVFNWNRQGIRPHSIELWQFLRDG